VSRKIFVWLIDLSPLVAKIPLPPLRKGELPLNPPQSPFFKGGSKRNVVSIIPLWERGGRFSERFWEI